MHHGRLLPHLVDLKSSHSLNAEWMHSYCMERCKNKHWQVITIRMKSSIHRWVNVELSFIALFLSRSNSRKLLQYVFFFQIISSYQDLLQPALSVYIRVVETLLLKLWKFSIDWLWRWKLGVPLKPTMYINRQSRLWSRSPNEASRL